MHPRFADRWFNGGLDDGIVQGGHVTWLQWHRLRRSMADPVFGLAVMAKGFRVGALMEFDLQVRGDGGFVVLHGCSLDRETTGKGPVAGLTGADLAGLRYRAQDCAPILSEDLAGLLAQAHPAALLQLDMKNTEAEVGAVWLDHFARVFAGKTAGIIVSGGSIRLIRALVERLPELKRGYDQTDDLLALSPDLAAMERHLAGVLRDAVKPDRVYLEWQMVLEAFRLGLDMVALAHAEGVQVDAWTHRMANPAAGFAQPKLRCLRRCWR